MTRLFRYHASRDVTAQRKKKKKKEERNIEARNSRESSRSSENPLRVVRISGEPPAE